MKKLTYILMIVLGFCGCKLFEKPEQDFILSGKFYRNCAKTAMGNVELEIVRTGGGLGGQKVTSLAKTKTSADGSFSITYRAVPSEELLIQIPANDQIQVYSPAEIAGLKAESIENVTLYLMPLTVIKVKIKCNKIYTNQDTLYITPKQIGLNTPQYEKIIAPQNGQIAVIWNQGGRSDIYGGWGLGWADYQKMRKSIADEVTHYNTFTAFFPTCENSPFEYELKID
jgi:hypothetical protein